MFGPEGAIAKYVDGAMGPLVVRRGNTVTPRTWGELGLVLQPEFGNGFARWVSPLEGGAAADAGGGSAGQAQTVFMLRPQPAEGTTGFVVEIDGQKLAYRNGPTQWNNFVWPNAAGAPGARIVATTFDGRTVEYRSLDASVAYKVTENLSIGLEGMNLLDEKYHSYFGTEKLLNGAYKSGRRYMASLRFAF